MHGDHVKRPCTCDKAQCRLCTLFHHDPAYRALWSDEQPAEGQPATGRPLVKRSLPCTYLGQVISRRQCMCRRDDVYWCSVGHGKVTQNGYCDVCPEYKPED
jgi:hypothetical protein